jgi:hypothetical protein
MHHILRRCGLSWFFSQRPSDRLRAQTGQSFQRDEFVGQEPQAPAPAALRRGRAGQRDQPRLVRPIQLAFVDPARRLRVQGRFKAFLDKAAAHALDAAHMHPDRLRHLHVGPARPTVRSVRQQKHPRMAQRARRGFAPRDQAIQFSSLLSRERHTVALVHGDLLTSTARRLAPISPHRKRDRALDRLAEDAEDRAAQAHQFGVVAVARIGEIDGQVHADRRRAVGEHDHALG